MKKSILIILLLISSISMSIAQPSTKEWRQMESFIEKAMADWHVPGVSLGIVRGNEVIYTRGFGLADVASGQAVDENTLFAIGSSSKAFTAFSVLQLVSDNLVKLDNPVRDYLPDLRMYDDYVGNHLSVRDLLCHRSGLPRHDVVWYGAADSREELFNKLKYLEPSAGFREYFQYQNLMYMTAGYLVGQMRQSTWENEVQQRIFTPLEMTRANFSVEKMKQDPNHARPYLLQEDSLVLLDFRNIDAVGPAGSINSSAREMCNWVIAQIRGGKFNGQELLPASVLAEAQTPAMPVPSGWTRPLAFDNGGGPISYGLGWFISTHKGRKMLQHGGNIDGFSAMVGFIPQDSVGVVVLTNLNGNPLAGIIRNYVFDLMLGEKVKDWNGELLKNFNDQRARQDSVSGKDSDRILDTRPSHRIEDYSGSYANPAYGTMKIDARGDSIHFDYHSIDVVMGHYHYDVFSATHPLFGPMKVAFHTGTDGKVSHVSIKLEPAVDEIAFVRSPPRAELTESELKAFTGVYLVEGAQRLTVALDKGVLKITVPGQPAYTLEPESELTFNLKELDGFSAEFQKNESGVMQTIILKQPNGQFKGERVND